MANRVGVSKLGGQSGCIAGANIPDLDGVAAKISGAANSQETPAYCSLCGEKGHRPSAHADGNAVPSGEAKEVDGKTQFGDNDSEYTTGSKNYKLPGMRGKDGGQFIFG